MAFPITRLRRLRSTEVSRNMIRETQLTKNDLIMPLFVRPGKGVQNPINSMPGNYQLSVDLLVEKCKELYNKGVQSVLLFGIPEHKDEHGLVACEENGIVQQATRAIKKELPELFLIADVCNCEYTTHGHCGTVIDGDVDNDSTLITLGKQSVSLAQAGIDMIAPSDMMDGRVGFIRKALDDHHFANMPIMLIRPSTLRLFMVPSVMLLRVLLSLEIGQLTRWIQRIAMRLSAKWNRIL